MTPTPTEVIYDFLFMLQRAKQQCIALIAIKFKRFINLKKCILLQ